MRRIIAAAAVLILMLTFSAPVYAEGVKVLSDKGDRISVFDDVTIDKDVNGNVITVLGDVETNADINGLVVVVFGDVKINSTVAGQIITVFGNTKLGKNAIIRGSLFSMGVLDKDPGAKVMGQEVNIFGREMKLDMSEVLIVRVVLLLMFSIIVLLVGILYIAASKKKISGIEATIESNLGRKLLLGFLAYLGATIIFALLFITIIIPVLYFALIVLAAVISSICLGKLIMKAMNPLLNK